MALTQRTEQEAGGKRQEAFQKWLETLPKPKKTKKPKSDKATDAFLRKAQAKKRKKRKKKQAPPCTDRNSEAYRHWRMRVFRRDNFTCLRCGSKKNIQAHHCFARYAHNKRRRLDLSNGATVCVFCHAYEHPWMIKKLERKFGADTVAFEIAGREYEWGLLPKQYSCVSLPDR
jgi:transcriptional regulator of acetoin/glycerol metabolism